VRRARWSYTSKRFLECETTVRVRFHEVDSLRVVWHGHYLSYFEEGRNAFGREYGIDYQAMHAEGLVAPLVHLDIDYLAPARLDELLTVRARLHDAPGAWIPFRYAVRGRDGRKLAVGSSIQAFTDLEGQLLLARPASYQAFLDRHRDRFREG